MTPREVCSIMERGERILFIDARRASDWEADDRKLPGAMRVPESAVDTFVGELPRGAELVVYCACPGEMTSDRVARRLRDLGYSDACALAGGFQAWIDDGCPLEMKTRAAEHAP